MKYTCGTREVGPSVRCSDGSCSCTLYEVTFGQMLAGVLEVLKRSLWRAGLPDTEQRAAFRLPVCITGTVEGLGARNHLDWPTKTHTHTLLHLSYFKITNFFTHAHEYVVTLDKRVKHAVGVRKKHLKNNIESNSHTPLVFALSAGPAYMTTAGWVCGDWHWNGSARCSAVLFWMTNSTNSWPWIETSLSLTLHLSSAHRVSAVTASSALRQSTMVLTRS